LQEQAFGHLLVLGHEILTQIVLLFGLEHNLKGIEGLRGAVTRDLFTLFIEYGGEIFLCCQHLPADCFQFRLGLEGFRLN